MSIGGAMFHDGFCVGVDLAQGPDWTMGQLFYKSHDGRYFVLPENAAKESWTPEQAEHYIDENNLRN